jgi:DNA (cytosine-5)-methyltransferase 1
VLDAQWFGVPQRRRRIFALSDFGNWRDRPPILFERESLCGNPTPSREKGEGTAADVAPSITSSGPPFSRTGNSRVETEALVTTFSTPALGDVREDEIASTMQAKTGSAGETQNPAYVATYRKSRRAQSTTDHESWVEDDVANTINTFDVGDVTSGHVIPAVAFNWQEDRTFKVGEQANPLRASQTEAVAFTASERSNSYAWESEVNPTLNSQLPSDTSNLQYGIRQQMQVRRLTPVECCRLQGFSDDHLDITYRNKPAPDGAKYKALGNSMAVPVIRWIGKQIESNSEND